MTPGFIFGWVLVSLGLLCFIGAVLLAIDEDWAERRSRATPAME
jgi:hypothetical protein